MVYDGKILRRAREKFEMDKEKRRERFITYRKDIFKRQPRLQEIETQLYSTVSHIVSVAMRRGTDPLPEIEKMRQENLELQEEEKRLLKEMDLPEDALQEKAKCSLCNDSGYLDGKMCRCLQQYYALEQKEELSILLNQSEESFKTFSLDWYSDQPTIGGIHSPREHMKNIYKTCVQFAQEFGNEDRDTENLLIFGGSGLGKTFLSIAIAREVGSKGFSIVYDTAEQIFSYFSDMKFNKEEEAAENVERILNCDLLVIDALGTEIMTSLVKSALYQIINTRLVKKRSTIINGNLSPEEIAGRYSEPIASRIAGEYEILSVCGDDIRIQKKELKVNEKELARKAREEREKSNSQEISKYSSGMRGPFSSS